MFCSVLNWPFCLESIAQKKKYKTGFIPTCFRSNSDWAGGTQTGLQGEHPPAESAER